MTTVAVRAGSSRVAGLVLFTVIFSAVCVAASAEIRWHKDLATAQTASGTSKKPILVFFSGTGRLTEHHSKALEDPALRDMVATDFEALRLDYAENRNLATMLNIFKVGTLAIYDSSGNSVDQIWETLPLEELRPRIARCSGKPQPLVTPTASPTSRPATSTRTSKPAARPGTPTPPLMTPGNQPVPEPLPKGKLVAGPVTVSAVTSSPTTICMLDKGKKYVVVAEGVYSVWSTAKNKGVDACYKYEINKRPGQIQMWDLVSLLPAKKSFSALIRANTGQDPVYNPAHVYETIVTGEGKELGAYLHDTDYRDNSGEFQVKVYEAK